MRDICSTCGREFTVSNMKDLTRLGYDPAMVYECVNCATNGKVSE